MLFVVRMFTTRRIFSMKLGQLGRLDGSGRWCEASCLWTNEDVWWGRRDGWAGLGRVLLITRWMAVHWRMVGLVRMWELCDAWKWRGGVLEDHGV